MDSAKRRWRSLYCVLDFARGRILAEQTSGVKDLCFSCAGSLWLRVFSVVQSGAPSDVSSDSIWRCVAGQHVRLGRHPTVFYRWRDWVVDLDGCGFAALLGTGVENATFGRRLSAKGQLLLN